MSALENNHPETARALCSAAIAKDDGFALAHFWLAQAQTAPDAMLAGIRKAQERVRKATRAEQLLIDGWVAWRSGALAEALGALNELVAVVPEEPRAFTLRGQLRQSLGDLSGAAADFEKAIALDDKYGAAYNLLGFALAAAGQADPAATTIHKYVALAPNEPNAHDSLAIVLLRAGDLAGAAKEARTALALDGRFLRAHLTLGDALLFEGKGAQARKEYAALEGAEDPALAHEAAMHSARSLLFEDKSAEAERALVKEGDAARRANRPLESTEAFLEAARAQLERGALAEAGRGLKEASASLGALAATDPPIQELFHRTIGARILEGRVLALALLFERALAQVKAEELGAQLKALALPRADERLAALRGFIAGRAGDEAAALAGLEKADAGPLRLAYAQALARKNRNQAGVILDELAHRTSNDLDTALTRSRARKLLAAMAADSK